MSLKLTPWLLLSAFTFVACVEEEKTEEEETDTEETEEETDTDEETDTEPEATEVAIDAMGIMFYNGYQANDIAGVTIAEFGEEPVFGGLSIYLFSSVSQESCLLDWDLSADSVQPDAAYEAGKLTDGFGGADLEVWYGFEVTSAPTVRAGYETVCDNMDEFGQQLFQALETTTPSFGYGPMTEDLAGYIEGGADVSFTGIAGFDFLSESGRSYYGLNQAFAYEITEEGTTTWDPASTEYPQGTEIAAEEVPFAEGFYVANAFLSIAWQTQ